MSAWRFYQGLRNEWRWYRFDDHGRVITQSDQGFAELRGCMANAESAGFEGDAYQVTTRQTAEAILPAGIKEGSVQEPVAALAPTFTVEPDAPAA